MIPNQEKVVKESELLKIEWRDGLQIGVENGITNGLWEN